jgi:23S rRNA (adenine2030-N6)-methyltransferase
MNYRHAFHAGNFADVLKHAVLARILTYLHDKPTPFRVIDTHAGAGLYDLTGEEARRGGEWQDGIGRLMAAKLSGATAAFVAPYLDIVRAYNAASTDGALASYPGSPLIARALLRPHDRLVACEIEPAARASLLAMLRRDTQARIVDLDGWTALGAFVPPPERRGVVLIDPPFEQRDEFGRLARGLERAYRKWPTGIYLLWYPIKDVAAAETFAERVGMRVAKSLRIELTVGSDASGPGLRGAGMIVVNPPWILESELGDAAPELRDVLARDRGAAFMLRARSDAEAHAGK